MPDVTRVVGYGRVSTAPLRAQPAAIRFWAKVDKSDPSGCWPWIGGRDEKGYGLFTVHGRTRRAHRFAFENQIGPIPEGHHVLHRCDNPPCQRGDHLFTGTNDDNVADKLAKGREAHVSGRANGAYGCTWGIGNKHAAKLSAEDIALIHELRSTGLLQREIAAAVGVTQSHVSLVLSGKRWTS